MIEFAEISEQTRENLATSNLDPERVVSLIINAYREDLQGGEDVTSIATVPREHQATGEFRTRDSGVIAGVGIAIAALELVGITDHRTTVHCAHEVESGTVFLQATGSTRRLLLAERTALNFLGHLSGIATLTRRWVDEVSEFGTTIRDTRKTTPGLRQMEKYAVRMGGGVNHRMSLSESVLIKDNHIQAAGGVREAFDLVRILYPNIEVEVEVDTLDQLSDIIDARPDLILLDNMSVEECQHAVEMVGGKIRLEASGGLNLANAKAYARTGVDFLAVGALTHSAPVLDIGLDLKAEI